MKIAKNQPSNSRDESTGNGSAGTNTNENNNVEKKRLTTKKLIPHQYKNQEDKSGSDSDSSWCSNVSTQLNLKEKLGDYIHI